MCGGGDSDADCVALRALYSAWGDRPASWSDGIDGKWPLCTWDLQTIHCSPDERVVSLCVIGDCRCFATPVLSAYILKQRTPSCCCSCMLLHRAVF